jgi:hypothetical protein
LPASVVFADKNEKSEGERQSRTREFVISFFYFLITAIAVETFGLVFASRAYPAIPISRKHASIKNNR